MPLTRNIKPGAGIDAMLPFQVEGAEFLANNPHGLLADEPGLGKTCQYIRAAELSDSRTNLVVCPASARLGTQELIEKHIGGLRGWDVISFDGATSKAVRSTLAMGYDSIIIDEEHYAKTSDSQRTQAIFGKREGLVRRAKKNRWSITGTPIPNRPRELYPMLKTLHGRLLGKYNTPASFDYQFCGAFYDGFGINNRGASNLKHLKAILNQFMLRRTKRQIP